MSHKIGLVGAGGVAGVHAAILTKDSRVKVHSFFDVEAVRSQALAARFGGHAAGTLVELLEQSDAVFVCTPNTTHEEVATQVL
ncbi:MAG: Gfo/Idh/MocA family oxidoreductase, partial [Candidatus Acidiferrum sp.]